MGKKASTCQCSRCEKYYQRTLFMAKTRPEEPIARLIFQTKMGATDRVFTLCDSCLYAFMNFVKKVEE